MVLYFAIICVHECVKKTKKKSKKNLLMDSSFEVIN